MWNRLGSHRSLLNTMTQDRNILFQNEYASCTRTEKESLSISTLSPKPWSVLSAEENKALLDILRQIKEKYPLHMVSFSSSDDIASISLIASEISHLRVSDFHTGGNHDPLYPSIRTLLTTSHNIDIITAFIQDSGLRIIQPLIFDALARGSHIRIVGGDYLHITQGNALQRLLDWKQQRSVNDWPGTLSIFIYESQGNSFHPKCWHFQTPEDSLAYVGSSNLSFTALCRGVEWNLAIRKSQKPFLYDKITRSIEHMCVQTIPLTQEWVNRYMEEAEKSPQAPLPIGEAEWEEEEKTPYPIQQEALEALQLSRQDGRKRALIVMATGLGKTYVSIFDSKAIRAQKILFIAHRKELLTQASNSFRFLYPKASFAWFVGQEQDTSGMITFASVQKISRSYTSFAPDHFDYIIIDEVHHATAKSYQSIIDYFQPSFLLGLTATPDRNDQSDIRALFDDHCAFQAGLYLGISRQLLVPFHYIGRLDPIDYNNIPWNHQRFDEEILNEQLCSDQRMQRLLSLWQEHPGTRTLVFCSSIVHCDSVGSFLSQHDIKTAVLHSKSHSDPREESIEALEQGNISCICTVDLFNEGIDIPSLDRIIMLRPTSSGIVFLQQLGRGLRLHPNKDLLTVIDLVGNHQVFLQRLHALSTISHKGGIRTLLSKKSTVLPTGCTLDIDVGVIDLISSLLGNNNPTQQLFDDYCTIFGHRPTLSALYQLGGKNKHLYQYSWLSFLEKQKKLTQTETLIFHKYEEWFVMLEHTPMTKSYKMVSLAVLIGSNSLVSGMDFEEFIRGVRSYLLRDPLLHHDAPNELQQESDWKRYFMRWLSNCWNQGTNWLVVQDGRIQIPLQIPNALIPPFATLSMEMIHYRLQSYRNRIQAQPISFDVDLQKDTKGTYFFMHGSPEQLPLGPHIVRDSNNRIWKIHWKYPKTRKWELLAPEQSSIEEKHDFVASRYRVLYLADGWHIEAIGTEVAPFVERMECTLIDQWPSQESTIWIPKRVPPSPLHFVIRSPRDIDGLSPIQKGDWLLMRWRNSAPQTAKITKGSNGISLYSATEKTDENIIAALDTHFSPQELAPPPGTSFATKDVAIVFGLSQAPTRGFSRVDGHLFLCLNKDSTISSPTQYNKSFASYPEEIAHTIYWNEDIATYLGIAYPHAETWNIPTLLWSMCQERGLSPEKERTLPMEEAHQLFCTLPTKGWWTHMGLRAHIQCKSTNTYTLLLEGEKYLVSKEDLAWAMYAQQNKDKSLIGLSQKRYLLGYSPNKKQRKALLCSWLCVQGMYSITKPKKNAFFVDKIRSAFPKQNTKKDILLTPILLGWKDSNKFICIQSHASPQEEVMFQQYIQSKYPYSTIKYLYEEELYDATQCLKTITHFLEP